MTNRFLMWRLIGVDDAWVQVIGIVSMLPNDAREHGCAHCLGEVSNSYTWSSLQLLFADALSKGDIKGFIEDSAINAERYPGGYAGYRNAYVYRCESCRALWFLRYEEIFTEDRKYEEWGHRCYDTAPLTEDDLAELQMVMATGGRIQSDKFVRRTAPEDPQA